MVEHGKSVLAADGSGNRCSRGRTGVKKPLNYMHTTDLVHHGHFVEKGLRRNAPELLGLLESRLYQTKSNSIEKASVHSSMTAFKRE